MMYRVARPTCTTSQQYVSTDESADHCAYGLLVLTLSEREARLLMLLLLAAKA